MNAPLSDLQGQVRTLLLKTGGTTIPSVTPYRFTGEHIPMPRTERPYLYIVLDGVLRLHTPSGMMDYMAGQYSISQIDTPFQGRLWPFPAIRTSWQSLWSSSPARPFRQY